MGDMDRLDYLLERQAILLDSATAMLSYTVAQGLFFSARQQDIFDWANAKADDLGRQADGVLARLHERGYKPENRTRYVQR